MKKKICIVTGSRAEYGLLYWLLKEIEASQDFELQLIVTGMHLSAEFGLTYKEIEKDFMYLSYLETDSVMQIRLKEMQISKYS